jgi:hypothetical protein
MPLHTPTALHVCVRTCLCKFERITHTHHSLARVRSNSPLCVRTYSVLGIFWPAFRSVFPPFPHFPLRPYSTPTPHLRPSPPLNPNPPTAGHPNPQNSNFLPNQPEIHLTENPPFFLYFLFKSKGTNPLLDCAPLILCWFFVFCRGLGSIFAGFSNPLFLGRTPSVRQIAPTNFHHA